jgi:hypothetical protein
MTESRASGSSGVWGKVSVTREFVCQNQQKWSYFHFVARLHLLKAYTEPCQSTVMEHSEALQALHFDSCLSPLVPLPLHPAFMRAARDGGPIARIFRLPSMPTHSPLLHTSFHLSLGHTCPRQPNRDSMLHYFRMNSPSFFFPHTRQSICTNIASKK